MQTINIPFVKIEYLDFSKEQYEQTTYNRMSMGVKCEGGLNANLSFYWKDEDAVPAELLEFISNTGINIGINSGGDE